MRLTIISLQFFQKKASPTYLIGCFEVFIKEFIIEKINHTL